MQTREQHAGEMEKRLERWGASFDEFTAKAKGVGAEVKIDYEMQIAKLKSKQQAVSDKLSQLKAASDDDWESLQTGVENAWKELEKSFEKMSS